MSPSNSETIPDQAEGLDFRGHMDALQALATRIESGTLDPEEALAVCREADVHFKAAEAILDGVEKDLNGSVFGKVERAEGVRGHSDRQAS